MGSGFRTFTAGEVLTASNVQNFLQNQSVMVFADSTARATSIGTANFEEGMVSYLEDTDTVEVYDGSAWGSIAPATTQGLTLINTTSFSAVATQSFNNVFNATYDNYRILLVGNASGAVGVTLRLRAAGSDVSTNTYSWQESVANGTGNVTCTRVTSTSSFNIGAMSSGAKHFTQIEIASPFLAQDTNLETKSMYNNTNPIVYFYGGFNSNSTSYDGFTLIPASGTITGTVSVYGYND